MDFNAADVVVEVVDATIHVTTIPATVGLMEPAAIGDINASTRYLGTNLMQLSRINLVVQLTAVPTPRPSGNHVKCNSFNRECNFQDTLLSKQLQTTNSSNAILFQIHRDAFLMVSEMNGTAVKIV